MQDQGYDVKLALGVYIPKCPANGRLMAVTPRSGSWCGQSLVIGPSQFISSGQARLLQGSERNELISVLFVDTVCPGSSVGACQGRRQAYHVWMCMDPWPPSRATIKRQMGKRLSLECPDGSACHYEVRHHQLLTV